MHDKLIDDVLCCVALAASARLDGWHWSLLFPAAVVTASALWSRRRALRNGDPSDR